MSESTGLFILAILCYIAAEITKDQIRSFLLSLVSYLIMIAALIETITEFIK